MFTPAPPKRNKNVITIKVDPLKVRRGHQPRMSGAGTHLDRRSRRLRTRSAQQRVACSD